MDLNSLTVASTRTAILERQTSAVALVESFYKKIEATDEKIGAYLMLTREHARDCRFAIITWRNPRCLNCRHLRILPIIVASDNIPVAVHQSQFGVSQDIWHIKWRLAQGWSQPANDYLRTAVTSFGNEAGNHHVVISANKTSG